MCAEEETTVFGFNLALPLVFLLRFNLALPLVFLLRVLTGILDFLALCANMTMWWSGVVCPLT